MATRRVTRVGQTILVRRAIREQRRTRTLRRAVLVAAVVAATALESWSARPAAADAVSPTVSRVILTDASGAAGPLVRSLGGVVHADLPLINAVVADLPAQAVDQLRSKVGVVVTPDAPVAVAEYSALPSDVTSRGPAAVFPESTGATGLHAEGTTGRGVDVAVLDTGIDPLPDFGNRLIDGVDLSGEGDPFLDSYGHGTFVAGVIAGSGASSGGAYQGEAPGAGLVSVKVAGASGVTDLATVIAGISWVVNNRTADNIGLLNISMGIQPWTSTVLNPLDRAVEVAWSSGVTVVVSAGNSGPFNGTVMSPGDDPMVVRRGLDWRCAAADDLSPYRQAAGVAQIRDRPALGQCHDNLRCFG